MSQIHHQVHDKFKVFVGAASGDSPLGALADEVANFASQSNAAAKSIGAEFVDSAGLVVLTLGYTTDEPGYPVSVQAASIGHLDPADSAGAAAIEAKIEDAAADLDGIICHCPYISADGEFFMVFLLHHA